MPTSGIWDRITDAGPAMVVLVGATVALLALPILRWLAPRSRRHRGGPARLFLGIAVLLAAGAVTLGTMGATSPGNILQLLGVLALMIGLVGTGGLLVFDVVLLRLRIDVPSILRDLIVVSIAVAIGMGFLRLAGLDIFSLVTTSAVLTAVIGLALQSTIANVFGGLSLQLDRTLRHGEWIEVGTHVGKILEIGWRSTRIQTKDGDTIFVPNGELVSKEVLNFGRPTGAHRIIVRVGFHYRHSPNEVRRVLLAAIRDTPGVLGDPQPECGPVEFGDHAVVYALRYWIADFAHDVAIDEEVHARVWYAARRAGLEIPFPIRTLVSQHGAAIARATTEAHEQTEMLRLLEATAPFSRLDDESRRRCARGARRLEFGQGECLLRPGDPDNCLSVIASGEVGVRLRSNGPSGEEMTLRAGELLTQRVLPGRDPDAPGCLARSEVVLYQLDDRALEEILAADPELAASLATIAASNRAALEQAGRSPTSSLGHPAPGRPGGLAPRIRRLFEQP